MKEESRKLKNSEGRQYQLGRIINQDKSERIKPDDKVNLGITN